MSKEKKVYWIGDEGDNKSVLIDRKVYTRGEEIPADKVDGALLKEWLEKGLISEGDYHAPVIIKDTDAVKALESEIKGLKADLESLPALRKKNEELEKALEKAKSGKKADAIKALEDDVKEKAALIEQQEERIVELEKQVEDLTDPSKDKSGDGGGGAGPGGG
jgi:predicted RNase H-like nuclease (RuvC/YqgF family)